jgi:hypothetical protein
MDAAATMKMTQRIGRHGQLEKCQVSRVDPQEVSRVDPQDHFGQGATDILDVLQFREIP